MSKRKLKSGLMVTAIVLLAIAVVSLFVTVGGMKTTKKLIASDFGIGAISTETGRYVESNQSIYLEELYEIENAEIKLEENSTIKYKMFFYGEDENFISATTALSTDFDGTSIPENAKYFRLVITPDTVDGEAVEVTILNILRYVNQIEVTVSK